MVPHRSTNQARTCLTSLSRREAVLSCWYGRSRCFVTPSRTYTLRFNENTYYQPTQQFNTIHFPTLISIKYHHTLSTYTMRHIQHFHINILWFHTKFIFYIIILVYIKLKFITFLKNHIAKITIVKSFLVVII